MPYSQPEGEARTRDGPAARLAITLGLVVTLGSSIIRWSHPVSYPSKDASSQEIVGNPVIQNGQAYEFRAHYRAKQFLQNACAGLLAGFVVWGMISPMPRPPKKII